MFGLIAKVTIVPGRRQDVIDLLASSTRWQALVPGNSGGQLAYRRNALLA